jgi:hypothetical protein
MLNKLHKLNTLASRQFGFRLLCSFSFHIPLQCNLDILSAICIYHKSSLVVGVRRKLFSSFTLLFKNLKTSIIIVPYVFHCLSVHLVTILLIHFHFSCFQIFLLHFCYRNFELLYQTFGINNSIMIATIARLKALPINDALQDITRKN